MCRFLFDKLIYQFMAKVRSIVTLSGTYGGITFVNSRAYKPHIRQKRGTLTPVTLSEGMKASARDQTHVNQMAKILFDEVNEFAPYFKNGRFWSRLLSVFRQQKKAGRPYNYDDFDMMEVRKDYYMSRFGSLSLKAVDADIKFTYHMTSEIGHLLSIMRIATDETLLIPYPTEIKEIWVNEGERAGVVPYIFTALPAGANTLYVLKCEQFESGVPTGYLKDQSVCFLTGKE
jgi:hypothetical protein